MILSTVCYLKNGSERLMLHRVKKQNDVNHGKWIGVGGKLIAGESPTEAAKREIIEETGLKPDSLTLRGILTFVYADREAEYIFVYEGTVADRALIDCNEGRLAWIPEKELDNLALWDGDRLFLPLLFGEEKFFSLKLVYNEKDELLEATFD